MDKELELIEKALKKNGMDAYKRTLAAGREAVVVRGNNVVAVSPDGNVRVIKRLEHSTFRVKNLVMPLKSSKRATAQEQGL